MSKLEKRPYPEDLAGKLRWWATECDRTNFGCQTSPLLLEAADAIETSRPQPNNPPLTLGELRGMNGEPVWVEPIGAWRIVNVDRENGFVRLFTVFNIVSAKSVFNNNGRIYRRKPEGGEG